MLVDHTRVPPGWDEYEPMDGNAEILQPLAPIEASDGKIEGIVPLGHDRGVFYYLSRSARQIFALGHGQHSKNALMAMASVTYYWQRSKFFSSKTNQVRWDEAVDDLMRQCRDVGIFNPDRVRGRGAWMDDGRSVLHVGDRLLVDGRSTGLNLPGSTQIYEAAPRLIDAEIEPMTSVRAHELVKVCARLRWERPIYGTLLAGFIAVAPICGGLSWRPSIWITGGSGSGKSYLKDNILTPALGGIALLVQSKTSEAGIRQRLGSDARPVIFDEAEAEDQAAALRMQGVLDLMRQSASEGGAEIVKGGQDGKARSYRIRSCFAFSSINVSIQHNADASRVSVLALRDPDSMTDSERATSERQFQELNALVQATITPDFSAALVARSVRLLPVIRANAERFAVAVSLHLGSRRTGDQLGALLAGAYSLHSEREITAEEATSYIAKQTWDEATESDEERDEVRLLNHLTQHRHRFSPGNGAAQEATVGRLIDAAFSKDQAIAQDVADLELRQIGILATMDQEGIYVSTGHPALARILAGTPWAAGWSRSLARLPGAIHDRKNKRFTPRFQSKAVWVPMREAADAS